MTIKIEQAESGAEVARLELNGSLVSPQRLSPPLRSLFEICGARRPSITVAKPELIIRLCRG
jgi:hypothetical protein